MELLEQFHERTDKGTSTIFGQDGTGKRYIQEKMILSKNLVMS